MNQLPLLVQKRPVSISTNPKYFKTETDESKLPQLKNYDIAIDYYTKGINNDKTNIYFLIKRAICYLGKGFYTLALKDALKTIQIDKKYQEMLEIQKEFYENKLLELENEVLDLKSKIKNVKDNVKDNEKAEGC